MTNVKNKFDNYKWAKAEPHEIPSYPGTSTGTAKIVIKEEDMPTQSHTLLHPWPIGTRVRINPGSEYEYQTEGSSGTITDNQYDKSHIYQVKWDKGASNCYRPGDLLLENPLLNDLIDPNLVKEMVDFSEKYSTKPTNTQVNREVSVDLYIPKGNDTLDTKVTRSRPITIDLKEESKVLLF